MNLCLAKGQNDTMGDLHIGEERVCDSESKTKLKQTYRPVCASPS